MKTPTLILLSLLTSVVFGQQAESLRFSAAETSLPTFSDKLLQSPELLLSQAIATGQLPPTNIQPAITLASVRRLAEQRGGFVSKMPIISPSGNIDPNMPILVPDPSIDFRMQVVEPKVVSVK
jgi:hypothetical protein